MTSVIAQIPNVLTLSRIAAAPILILLLRDESFELALILFVLAGLTDGLDGWIAKRFNCASQLGARLDPLADKNYYHFSVFLCWFWVACFLSGW